MILRTSSSSHCWREFRSYSVSTKVLILTILEQWTIRVSAENDAFIAFLSVGEEETDIPFFSELCSRIKRSLIDLAEKTTLKSCNTF